MSDGKLFRLGDLVERDPKTRAGPALGVVIDSSLAPYDYRILYVSRYGQGCVRNLWEGHERWDIARRER